MIITVLLIAFIGLISIDLDSRLLNRIYDYVFEFYINSVSDGGVSTESTTLLWQMITTPMSSETMLYGDGYWLDTESNKFYYKNVDFAEVQHRLARRNIPIINHVAGSRSVTVKRPKNKLFQLAALPFVLSVEPTEPPVIPDDRLDAQYVFQKKYVVFIYNRNFIVSNQIDI